MQRLTLVPSDVQACTRFARLNFLLANIPWPLYLILWMLNHHPPQPLKLWSHHIPLFRWPVPSRAQPLADLRSTAHKFCTHTANVNTDLDRFLSYWNAYFRQGGFEQSGNHQLVEWIVIAHAAAVQAFSEPWAPPMPSIPHSAWLGADPVHLLQPLCLGPRFLPRQLFPAIFMAILCIQTLGKFKNCLMHIHEEVFTCCCNSTFCPGSYSTSSRCQCASCLRLLYGDCHLFRNEWMCARRYF